MCKKICRLTLIANIKESVSIKFLERKLISTGILIKTPKNTRHSFSLIKKFIESICIIHITKNIKNKKYTLYNEIQIIVINVFFKNIMIEPNDELGIFDLIEGVKIKWEKCSILSRSIRGSNSFGSTGI
ncbi:Deoxyuridine 5-Triphosphate Nucleotidohydrolase [Blattabacterium sp. (Nauphoeta cinerea)]|uniref:deoxyuridine 5'-triphosphate nucleotidohydrolase n=1 Tax=Blattabacterium sp. (Nauphoeta cinerea) TaxID=1316444 RepID=UPI0003B0E015|nr:deoxyuridine 5'-triphosphate nucleotidohydrolase [Blattabacterium sp. (Nauphoeta cinerea)]AGW86351.1 Deoxyuridine 5-Triphosphate Nucleotidohydrolase [Blattabacterium sp. (Nauphoeta cinerea)]